MKTIIIYTLTDPITKEVRYVGKTTDISKRFNKHINESRKSTTSHKKAWIKSLLKKNLKPEIEIIDVVNSSDWGFWEKYCIEQIRAWGFRLTNETSGGDGVDKGNIPWNKGIKGVIKKNKTSFKKGNEIGKETRIKSGQRLSPKTEFKKGITSWNKGKERSEETKKKISKSNKGKVSKKRKVVIQYSMDMKVIYEFESVKSASNNTGINSTSISQVARGERKKAGGYKWSYKNEKDKNK